MPIDISRIPYEHYPLKKALIHRPETELASVTEETLEYFNFASVPNIGKFFKSSMCRSTRCRAWGPKCSWSMIS